ncbi:MAG TPA: glyoxalase [Cytophagales bacterium]|nr:glyoxalase [Cytophagales bacterium]HAA22175.1 glyoxalase [Cytophagales bacterium]HAP65096.1 glyoxalase [Cytophagales bacterium]
MKFAYTILYVSSVPDTLAFYEQAFGFARKFMTPEEDYGELITGETTLAFASLALAESNFKKPFQRLDPKQPPFAAELSFTTETVDADYQRAIDAGAEAFEPLVQKPWGQTVGYVRDNNGFLIEICTPIPT